MSKWKILIVDDNKNVLSALNLLLQNEFEKVATISNPNQLPFELQKGNFDVILLDMNFSAGINTGNEGMYWLNEIKKTDQTIEVVMFTAYGDIELAVKATKNGAADFILKPWDNDKMIATLNAAYKLRVSNKEVKDLKSKEQLLINEINKEQKILLGSSVPMLKILQLISKVAKTDANILITGENGTGKEVIAREIHKQSLRSENLMVSVDMGAIPDTLFESELFGHKKGAFTDAIEDRIGKFQLADKGTLFLDEIGNIPLHLQSKLLVALQTRKVMAVGSNIESTVDIRIICATNQNPEQMVEQGIFREDLLYRINTIHIEVPPLRERKEDIELLATFFLKKYCAKYHKPGLRMNSQVVSKLLKYNWPGNVRELEHTIEKSVILATSDSLSPDDFTFKTGRKNISSSPQTIEDMEKQMILKAMELNTGNMSAAANQLGVTRQTLYNKIKKYGIEPI